MNLPNYSYNRIITLENFKPEDCQDDACKMDIANTHSVSVSIFEDMIYDYWGLFDYAPMVYEIADILPMIVTDDINSGIWFEYNDEIDNNQDIILIADKKFKRVIKAVYSKFLFQGILLLHPDITHFDFYKVKHNGHKTVGILARVEDDVLYTGNMSDIWP